MKLGNAAAIIGFGDAYADKDNKRDPLQLATEATAIALADADIKKTDVDTLFTGRAPWSDCRPQWNNIFASHLQMPVKLSTEVTFHGAGVNAMLGMAVEKIATGQADYVLCVQSDATPLFVDTVAMGAATDADPQFEYPYGPTIPALYAQWACRYMHEFGVTEEDLAMVAVQHQDWGIHHPKAAKRRFGKIDIETVMNSPYIAAPLRRWMCATWGPGGTAGAFIVASAEKAASARAPIYINGYGSYSTHEYLVERMALRNAPASLGALPNLTTTGLTEAAAQAYAMADMRPGDMDMVQLSGNFAHTVLMELEDLGFAEKGKAMDLVRSGAMEPGGSLPVDTNGGWLSFGQPGISCTVDSIVEAVRQLRGDAMGLGVPDAERAIVYGGGGMLACHAVSILSNKAS